MKQINHLLADDEVKDFMNELVITNELRKEVRLKYNGQKINRLLDLGQNPDEPGFCMDLRDISVKDIYCYVYAIMMCPGYRSRFIQEWRSGNHQLPLMDDFNDFKDVVIKGNILYDWHIDYEAYEYDLEEEDLFNEYNIRLIMDPGAPPTDKEERKEFFMPDKQIRFIGDKSKIRFNKHITIVNIPPEAYDYSINGISAVEWAMQKYSDVDTYDKNMKRALSIDSSSALATLLSVIDTALLTVRYKKELPDVWQ